MSTFMWLGLIFLVAVVVGAQFMQNPPAGYKPEGWNPPQPAAGATAVKADYTWQEMLGTPQFWLLWVTYVAGCTAGLMVIMNVTNVWQSFSFLDLVKSSPTLNKDAVAGVLGACATAVMLVAVFNALGRIVWGKVSDSIGRKGTLVIMFALAGLAMLALNWLSSYALYVTGVSLVGFCFGGFLALYPAVTADYFGTKNVGANYGFMFSTYGAGGLLGPWLAPKLMSVLQKIPYEKVDKAGNVTRAAYDAGNFLTAFVISAGLCFLAVVIVLLLKPPAKKA
jgi:OFA family oxalate/formate antiporter-like MFS transporter